MNNNSYYITTYFISYNINSYYSVITITVYQTCLRYFKIIKQNILLVKTYY